MENYLADEQTGIELLYRGEDISDIAFADIKQFNKVAKELELNDISDVSRISKEFNIPQHYKELDVEKYIHDKLIQRDPDEIGRVEMELEMYKERGLFPVLQLLPLSIAVGSSDTTAQASTNTGKLNITRTASSFQSDCLASNNLP